MTASQQNWIQHVLRRTGWRPRTQATALIAMGVLLTLIFGGVYLSQVATFTQVSREISALLEERDRLEFTNEQLRADIAELKRVPLLQTRARELGFRDAVASDIEYLMVDGYNPNRDRTVVPEDETADFETELVYDETFSGWLQQTFDSLRAQFETFGN